MTNSQNGFELEDARRQLIAARNAAGADTPIGHRYSNLIEQLENVRGAVGDQRAHLAKGIQQQMAELTDLSAKSGKPQG